MRMFMCTCRYDRLHFKQLRMAGAVQPYIRFRSYDVFSPHFDSVLVFLLFLLFDLFLCMRSRVHACVWL